MKRIFYILLLLVTALYVLPPVKSIYKSDSISCTEKNTDKPEEVKKEESKEFLPQPPLQLAADSKASFSGLFSARHIPFLSQGVITPPPDITAL